MTWLALGLFAKRVGTGVITWLSHRSFWQLVCIGLAIFAAVQHFELAHSRAEAAKWHKQYTDEHAGRIADRTAYTKAQTDAAALNKAQVERAKAEQERINNAKVSNLDARLELIRSELRKASSAPQRPASGAPSGSSVEGPCRVIDPAWMCLSPSDRLHAAENEERHDELIDLVIEQSQVDPNK